MDKPKRLKPYKNASPIDTVHRIRQILYENQIFLIEIKHIKEPLTGVCSCRVILGDENLRALNIGSNGKGMDTTYALASAYAEFMERLQNGALLWKTNGITNYMPNSYLVSKKDYIQISKDLLTKAFGYSKQIDDIAETFTNNVKRTLATTFTEYQTGETLQMPIALLNTLTGSNGMAAGNTITEAIIQGLSEIFERVSLQQLFLNCITPPVIDECLFEDTDVLSRLRNLKKRNIDFKILDCSLGIGLPVIALLLERDQKYHIQFGADPSPITALERCLTETFQGRTENDLPLFSPLNMTDDLKILLENERKEFTDSSGSVPEWIINGKTSWNFNGFAHPVTVSDQDDLDYYMSILVKLNKKLYIKDTSVLKFPSVRLYVPELTEKNCLNPEYCIKNELPKKIETNLMRLPLLNEMEYKELAGSLVEWLEDNFDSYRDIPNIAEKFNQIKLTFPAGFFAGRQWDCRLLIAAIYFRGGLSSKGNQWINEYLTDSTLNDQQAAILKIKLRSSNLVFLPTEFPQCPDCSVCKAKDACYKKKVEDFQSKYLSGNQ